MVIPGGQVERDDIAVDVAASRAMPLRYVPFPRVTAKKRPLGIPFMRCRAMQALCEARSGTGGGSTGGPEFCGFCPNARRPTPSNSASSLWRARFAGVDSGR